MSDNANENNGGGQETNNEHAWSGIEDEGVRGLMETKGYDSYEKLATAYSHLNALNKGSPNVVALPGDDADDKAMGDFWGKLGRPDDPTGYDIQLPEGTQVDEEFFGKAKEWMHGIGLNSKQANAFIGKYQEYVTERMANETTANDRAQDAAVEELKKEFGDDLDDAILRGKNVIKAFNFDDEMLDGVEKAIGAPALMKMLAKMGEKIGKEDVRIDGVDKNGFGKSAPEMRARQETMRGNPEIVAALTNPNDPNHKRYKAEWDEIVLALAKGEG